MAQCKALACGRWRAIVNPQFLLHDTSDSLCFLLGPKIVGWRENGRKWCVLRSSTTKLVKIGRLQSTRHRGRPVVPRFSDRSNSEVQEEKQEEHRPPFDLDLAVLLAGFAFDSYNTPPSNVGVREMDRGDCETVFLNKEFVRTVYDGQLVVKLQKGSQFPGLDFWGTSDVYVVLRLGNSSVQSKTIWGTRDPVWDETFLLNVKSTAAPDLKVAAWDENLMTTHRRLGNSSASLENLCDGDLHKLEINLEGMGGGGNLFLEVQFRPFDDKRGARQNQFSLAGGVEVLANAYESLFEASGISVGDFMKGIQLNQFSKFGLSKTGDKAMQSPKKVNVSASDQGQGLLAKQLEKSYDEISQEPSGRDNSTYPDEEVESWEKLAEPFSETLKSLGLDVSGFLTSRDFTEGSETAKKLELEFQKKADVQSEKAGVNADEVVEGGASSSKEEAANAENSSGRNPLADSTEALNGFVKQMDGVLGGWALFNKSLGENQTSEIKKAENPDSDSDVVTRKASSETKKIDEKMETRSKKTTMFSTAESAIEAWALLHTTLGGSSLVKSDFEKIAFVDNDRTDTQAAIWRDLRRKRLVVAFRGTEQTKWKDMVTDLSLLAAGFNPERVIDGNAPPDELLVHSGFLKAYDSVKNRLLSLVRASIDFSDGEVDLGWHIYVTGHSLGGALATLFALELSSSKLAKDHHVKVSMYNYGSPRVGNKLFAKQYNKVVKDSWRVVNSRDIVPSIPRLMGYNHVAQPIYLTSVECPVVQSELLDDDYQGDVIGEATPDIILQKFMTGEKNILKRLFETEIAILDSMRDGSAVMQHMEDFYYITLLQRVESRMFPLMSD